MQCSSIPRHLSLPRNSWMLQARSLSVSDQTEYKGFLLVSFIPLQHCTALHREFCCFVSVLRRHLTMEHFEHKPPHTPTGSYQQTWPNCKLISLTETSAPAPTGTHLPPQGRIQPAYTCVCARDGGLLPRAWRDPGGSTTHISKANSSKRSCSAFVAWSNGSLLWRSPTSYKGQNFQ